MLSCVDEVLSLCRQLKANLLITSASVKNVNFPTVLWGKNIYRVVMYIYIYREIKS